jgi:alpha-beta hydrolase superfamily lysophospholipase
MTRRILVWLGIALVAALVVAGAVLVISPSARHVAKYVVDNGLDTIDPVDGPVGSPVPVKTADLSDSGPGSLVSAMTIPAIERTRKGSDLLTARVVYRSTSGDTGQPTVISGAVFVPKGAAPSGGWPIVALGHGTTGIDEPCAPSLSNTLLGMSNFVDWFTGEGFAVAIADFQGLGADGVHPYTDGKTAGLNMIDSVRALRHAFGDVSDRWAAIGGSQGGGASWAADEQAATYAPELTLVGAVAMSPAADVSGIVKKATEGTLTPEQQPAFVFIVESLARLHPDLNRDDYRGGAALKYWDVLASCSGPLVHDRSAAADALSPGDFAPRTPAAFDRLQALLKQWALPQQRLSAPLSVVYGGKDKYVDSQWTTDAIARACALGGTVEWDLQPDKGHSSIDMGGQLPWIKARFAAAPVTNDCP